MTLWYGFAPPLGKMEPAASQLRWMAALLLLLVIIHDKLTCLRLYDILIAGRDDAYATASPLRKGMRYLPPTTSDGWRLYFYFLWLFML